MKDYKRLTERDEFGNADIIGLDSHELVSGLHFDELNKLTSALNRFAELEDKIESGELVDRNEYLARLMTPKNASELTDKEIEFFVKHNTRVRENAEAEIAALQKRLENAIELPCQVGDTIYSLLFSDIAEECKVKSIYTKGNDIIVVDDNKGCWIFSLWDYGKTWFTDRDSLERTRNFKRKNDCGKCE